jgi:catechol 2,3-dioxygenase-like lactoylglutathione lyase family enzyme
VPGALLRDKVDAVDRGATAPLRERNAREHRSGDGRVDTCAERGRGGSERRAVIAQGRIYATLPTRDMERSRRFYQGALELPEIREPPAGGVWYQAAGGTVLHVYESGAASGRHTIATIFVDDFEQTIATLRANGVALEEYDQPGFKTEDGIWRAPEGFLSAWIKDPDGNILGIRSG